MRRKTSGQAERNVVFYSSLLFFGGTAHRDFCDAPTLIQLFCPPPYTLHWRAFPIIGHYTSTHRHCYNPVAVLCPYLESLLHFYTNGLTVNWAALYLFIGVHTSFLCHPIGQLGDYYFVPSFVAKGVLKPHLLSPPQVPIAPTRSLSAPTRACVFPRTVSVTDT